MAQKPSLSSSVEPSEPKPQTLTEAEQQSLVALWSTPAGRALLKELENLRYAYLQALIRTPDDHRYHQGVYSGITILAQKAEQIKALAARKAARKPFTSRNA